MMSICKMRKIILSLLKGYSSFLHDSLESLEAEIQKFLPFWLMVKDKVAIGH
jgi:hypothetical protein